MKSEDIFKKQSEVVFKHSSMDTKLFCLLLLSIFMLCSDLLCISGRPLLKREISASEMASRSLPESGLDTKTSSASSMFLNRNILPPLPREVNSSGKWLPVPNLIPTLPVPSPAMPSSGMSGFPFIIPPFPGWGSKTANPSQPILPLIAAVETANARP